MKIIILGAGGHAKVLIEVLRSSKKEPTACLTPDSKFWKKTIEDVKIEGGDELLSQYSPKSVSLVNGVGSPRNAARRRAIFEDARARGYAFPVIQAASAICARSASFKEGAQILSRAVVHPGAVIGENVIVNTAAVVEHDSVVGDHSHIAPGAIVCGGVTIGSSVLIGAGAVVLPGIKIGNNALIAAGVVVRKNVPNGGRVLPARAKV
jgi:UDP-perosamine 4-acetyltransferase